MWAAAIGQSQQVAAALSAQLGQLHKHRVAHVQLEDELQKINLKTSKTTLIETAQLRNTLCAIL